MPLYPVILIGAAYDTRLPELFVDSVVHVPVHPGPELEPRNHRIEVRPEPRVQPTPLKPRQDAFRTRCVVGDDDGREPEPLCLLELRLDERPVLRMPPRRLARGEEPFPSGVVPEDRVQSSSAVGDPRLLNEVGPDGLGCLLWSEAVPIVPVYHHDWL